VDKNLIGIRLLVTFLLCQDRIQDLGKDAEECKDTEASLVCLKGGTLNKQAVNVNKIFNSDRNCG
jgi:hypothetical protein